MAEDGERYKPAERQARPWKHRLWLWATMGGSAIAAASGTYIATHHVDTPQQAVFSVVIDDHVLMRVDRSEMVAGVFALTGTVTLAVGASKLSHMEDLE